MNRPEIINFEIETLSPVSITDGDVLSPYSDFFVKNNKVHYIDHKKLNVYFKKNPALISNMVDGIRSKIDNNKSNFEIYDFIFNVIRINPNEVVKYVVDYKGKNNIGKSQLKTIIKNNNRPYIAGSTLKGAIKGAMLYSYAFSENGGLNRSTEAILDYLEGFTKTGLSLKEIDNLNRKLIEVRGRHRDLPFQLQSTYKKVNELREKLLSLGKNYIENLFGEIRNDSTMDFSNVQISDSSMFLLDNLEVNKTNRYSLKKESTSIPIITESIKPGSKTDFSISISKGAFKNSYVKHIFSDFNNLKTCVDEYTHDFFDYETWHLNLNNDDIDNIKNAKQFYDNLNGQNETNTIFLPIGMGKNFVLNSIGLMVFNATNDENIFKYFVKILGLGKPDQSYFPITRTITDTGLPLGWVKIKRLL